MSSTKSRETEALGMLGLARRAGAVLVGVDTIRKALRAEGLCAVLVARDASDTQLAKIRGILRHAEVPVRWVSGQTALGAAIGRAPLTAVGVTEKSFAELLARKLPPSGWNAA